MKTAIEQMTTELRQVDEALVGVRGAITKERKAARRFTLYAVGLGLLLALVIAAGAAWLGVLVADQRSEDRAASAAELARRFAQEAAEDEVAGCVRGNEIRERDRLLADSQEQAWRLIAAAGADDRTPEEQVAVDDLLAQVLAGIAKARPEGDRDCSPAALGIDEGLLR